jgi:hypothetical protein
MSDISINLVAIANRNAAGAREVETIDSRPLTGYVML